MHLADSGTVSYIKRAQTKQRRRMEDGAVRTCEEEVLFKGVNGRQWKRAGRSFPERRHKIIASSAVDAAIREGVAETGRPHRGAVATKGTTPAWLCAVAFARP